jgi:hypothetical protein
MRRPTAILEGKPQKMFWINSQLILDNVCGVAFALTFVRLMHCSGQTHQCLLDRAEANLFMELMRWLPRYQVQSEVMDQWHHRLTNHQVGDERNNYR